IGPVRKYQYVSDSTFQVNELIHYGRPMADLRSMTELLAEARSERLPQLFAQSFSVVRADTPELQDAFFRLRYQVYCIENDFENSADFPGGRETDMYDARSQHALLIHRPTSALIGGVRLISPGAE